MNSLLRSIGGPAALALIALVPPGQGAAQDAPATDLRIYDIIDAASASRVEADIRALADFGTRNTMSDTLSDSRGIGAARRWIKEEFDRISADCGGCLEVFYQRNLVEGGGRIPEDTWVVNVVAILRGSVEPNRYVIMSGDIDSRASNGSDGETDAPGANDNASGMAGVIEAARLLTAQRPFAASVVFAGLSGEEQGLWGGQHMAAVAREEGWEITGVLNNDMIGNIEGIDGVIDNTIFRVFSEATPLPEYQSEFWNYRSFGGEVDGPSRQLARYVDMITDTYFTNLDAKMVYRLDRFGRGGHHRPFNDAGFPGVRIMESHEHYDRQHQNIRVEDGRAYGDVIDEVDFAFAARLTAVNAAVLAALAWAPPAPANVRVGGANRPSTTLAWEPAEHPDLLGYRVYWRDTTAPQWEHSRFVGDVTEFTLENLVIDNYLFGVSAVSRTGTESVVSFPIAQLRR
ncbi:M28 family peptidase [Gaopeijia maritima]|uniref:M28 family peptidase n=1 Tax=Gaopeijia maritima TaxID=3119007 RepID=UPI0038699AF8